MSQINKVSSATKDAIKRKSAYALPDRPSDRGMKPEDIKRAFWRPIVDVSFSAISEIDRVVDELNTIMTENYDAHIADKNNPHAVTKAQVGLGNCNNTADADKPVSTPQRAALNTHNTATDAHNDIRTAITNGLATKVGYTDVIDGFASTEVDKPLSAYRGKVLYDSLQETIGKADYAIKNITLNSKNGILTITRTDGTSFTIDLPLEYIVKSGSYNASTKNIELVLDNDEKIEIPVGALVNEYYGDGTTITLYVDSADGNKPKFKISDTYKSKIDANVNARHTHSNASVLNNTTASFTTSLKSTYDGYAESIAENTSAINELVQGPYPVGAIYQSAESTSPASLFGGTWEQLTADAYFKIVTTGAGATGGTSASHTIPLSSIPSHDHNFRQEPNTGTGGITEDGATIQRGYASTNSSFSDIYELDAQGGGQPYYPYYFGVYAWKRIA